MKFEYDSKAKAAYLSLNLAKKRIVKTIEVDKGTVFVDFDSRGKPVGIEICNIGCLGSKDIRKGGLYGD